MSAVAIFMNVVLILILAAATGIILWRVITARTLPVYICLFLIMPVGYLLMLHSFSFDEWSGFWLVGLFFGLAANILLLVYTISQEKKTAAMEELRETRHMIELERSHYEAVEQRREELEKIRMDFNGKLEAIAGFTRSGEDAVACDSISALAEKINRTKENPYCAIPVINAVLTEKEKDCALAGIDLSVDLRLPHALAAEPMHLCSIFSNILDNAITACRSIRTGKGLDRPVIRLSSIMDGDYLIIKVTNPSGKPAPKPAPGRGYGLRIISELTKQYSGDILYNYHDGVFTVVLSLLVAQQ